MIAEAPRSFKKKLAYLGYLLIIRAELPFFMGIRRRLVNVMLGKKHVGLMVYPDVYISDYRRLRLGDNVSINRGCHLSAAGGLEIGDNAAIGHNSSFMTSNHGFRDDKIPMRDQPLQLIPVTIGDDVWIGARVCVLAGADIASGTVVAAGAVVTKPVTETHTVIGGVPARRIGHRFDREAPPLP